MTFVTWACGGSDLGGLATPRLGSSSLGPRSSGESTVGCHRGSLRWLPRLGFLDTVPFCRVQARNQRAFVELGSSLGSG